MKNKICSIILIIIGFATVVGCDSKPRVNHEYLMTHPAKLEKELHRCQEMVSVDTRCDVAKQAGRDFYVLINKRQQDPEGFGKVILQQQLAIANSKNSSPDQREQLAELFAAVAATSTE